MVAAKDGKMKPDSELAAKPPYKPPGIFWMAGLEFVPSAAYNVLPVVLPGIPLLIPPGTTRVLNPVAKPSVKIRLAVRATDAGRHCWKGAETGFTAAVMDGPTTPMLMAVPATGRVWFGLVEM